MSKRIGSSNGNDRRSGEDRRKAERRDPKRAGGKGVLTTRAEDRRKAARRAPEPEPEKPQNIEPEDQP